MVIANPSASSDISNAADITSNVTFFNGDDAIALLKNGVIIDVIGVIGSDPGSQWGSGDASTGENTIRRLNTVCSGDANGILGGISHKKPASASEVANNGYQAMLNGKLEVITFPSCKSLSPEKIERHLSKKSSHRNIREV